MTFIYSHTSRLPLVIFGKKKFKTSILNIYENFVPIISRGVVLCKFNNSQYFLFFCINNSLITAKILTNI